MASLSSLENLSKFLDVSGVENKVVERDPESYQKSYIEVVEHYIQIFPANDHWFDSTMNIYLLDDFGVVLDLTTYNFQEILKTIRRYKLIVDRDIEFTKNGDCSLHILIPRF